MQGAESSSPVRRSRRWGFACMTCRRRKVRCDGGKPVCHNCIKAGEDCAYKASEAVNNDLAYELRRRKDELDALNSRLHRTARLSGAERQKAVDELLGNYDGDTGPSTNTIDSECAEANQVSELSVDEDGNVQSYGATSRFHLSPYEAHDSKPDSGEERYHRRWLRSNARFQQSWEEMARIRLQDPLISNEITPEQAIILLDIYWTWQAPLHNYVYRRCFFRDMAVSGPYYSHFLLYTIFAHALRHVRPDDLRFAGFEKGQYFLCKAKNLLTQVLETPAIPTIQGLLLLGGRQCSVGKTSEGWLYTSMAIAMIKDMGLHLRRDEMSLYSDHEPDDLELRKRLYLSAYLWDKSLSLCLGRQPSLPDMPYGPRCLFDEAEDEIIWRPVHLGLDALHEQYPQPTRAYNTENFMSFVELATIVNQVYSAVYGARSRSSRTPAVLYDLEHRLRQFHRSLPAHLQMDILDEGSYSPPPHIFTVNILYRTLLILLYRPFYQSRTPDSSPALEKLAAHAHQVCTAEAIAVNANFRAYGRTYNFRMQTHLLSYCVYTAASVDVHGMQSKDAEEAAAATQRLQVTLHMLEAEAEQTPGVRKSIDIIRARIKGNSHDSELELTQVKSTGQPSSSETAVGSASSFRTVPLEDQAPQGDHLRFIAVPNRPHDHALEDYDVNRLDHANPGNYIPGSGVAAHDFHTLHENWPLWDDLDISGGFGPSDHNSFWQ